MSLKTFVPGLQVVADGHVAEGAWRVTNGREWNLSFYDGVVVQGAGPQNLAAQAAQVPNLFEQMSINAGGFDAGGVYWPHAVQKQVYALLGVDERLETRGESFYNAMLPGVLARVLELAIQNQRQLCDPEVRHNDHQDWVHKRARLIVNVVFIRGSLRIKHGWF